ncbi:glycosyltransferase [Brotaphodocola catenula]|uniref:Glycosyltransferase n=1 Tax=Brotaphodocola catenula TaxID=2885361 RepID=A0AAE3DKX3_9FIRM|nr:glycosyltransferase [Brotaphodocola catenula]MCC2165814.1 glycosyltransferase [Brotaphodocola catenula]
MKLLMVGPMTGISNTCRLRANALKKICDKVDIISIDERKVTLEYKVRNKLFNMGMSVAVSERNNENEALIEAITKDVYDIIWIDKGCTIFASTLEKVKIISPNSIIVNFSLDNMMERHNQSKQFLQSIHLYDVHITTKSFIIKQLYDMGAKSVIYTNQSYDEDFHYPREINNQDLLRLGADVGFVGMWEKERMEDILYLTRNGVKVRVFGDKKWKQCDNDNPNLIIENHGLYDDDYAKSFRCFKISLCFLRKMNHDLHTSRSMEIPACGGFMMAERTVEHQKLFKEDKEAVFFSSKEELLKKCKYYLSHDEERIKIVENGRNRCLKSGYSNIETLRRIIDEVQQMRI